MNMPLPTTTQYLRLSVFDLNQAGAFTSKEPRRFLTLPTSYVLETDLKLHVDTADGKVILRRPRAPFEIEQVIVLTRTSCFFGGYRYWFVCACGDRVGMLYLAYDGFSCRTCLGLAYPSQQKTHSTPWAFCERYQEDEKRHLESYCSLRVKLWNGRPTKRYERLLERMRKHSALLWKYLQAERKVLGIPHGLS